MRINNVCIVLNVKNLASFFLSFNMLSELENLSIQESRLDEQIRLLSYAFPSAALFHCFFFFNR